MSVSQVHVGTVLLVLMVSTLTNVSANLASLEKIVKQVRQL